VQIVYIIRSRARSRNSKAYLCELDINIILFPSISFKLSAQHTVESLRVLASYLERLELHEQCARIQTLVLRSLVDFDYGGIEAAAR